MGLPEVIKVDKTKCQHCLACLLVCPVKLCNVVEPDGISVNPDLCIGCGECLRACREKGHHARSGIDDFTAFLGEVGAGVPTGVLVAPSAAVDFYGQLPQMITALKNMGVQYVFDVSFGAEIATYHYLKLVQSGGPKPIIAQPCPAVVSYIEIYQPELIPYLASTHSPALAAAQWVKSQLSFRNLSLAFLGPCFAKRREVHDPNTRGVVSHNITFQSLHNYLQERGISLDDLPPSAFDSPEAERAVIFSQPGGLTETFRRFGVPVKKADIPRVEGPQEVYLKYLPELNHDISKGLAPILVDILNCQHGCNIGPAATHEHSHFQVDLIMDQRREEQIKKHQSTEEPNPRLFEEYYKWIDAENIDFSRGYTDNSLNKFLREPSLSEEEFTWARMHKLTQDEREVNCASCGYGNCRSMMKAVVNGLNHIESCKYYLLKENDFNFRKVQAQAEELQKSRDEIAGWNEVLERIVAQRTTAIRSLLDHAGQGFLSFGEDLLVSEEYSAECFRIFGEEIGGRKFSEILFQREKDRNFLDNLIQEVFRQDADDEMKVEIYLSLLPKEVEINGRNIEIEYKMIEDEIRTCMAILTDVTDKRLLENQMEQEKNTLKMVVKVVAGFEDFTKTLKEYQNFYEILAFEIIGSAKPAEKKIAEIFRHVHTFKGSFSQFYMTGVSRELHEMENQLTAFSSTVGSETDDEHLRIFIKSFPMHLWLEDDLNRLRESLGPDFFSGEDNLTVSKAKLAELERKVESILPPAECKILVTELRRLRFKPFASMLDSYRDYVMKLAENFDKRLYPVEVEADPIMVDPARYDGFIRSLIHVFRNAIDHGIESVEERIMAGKDDYGRIKCYISGDDNTIKLVIADDGRGIDTEKIAEKLVSIGVMAPEEAARAAKGDLLNYIFMDAFSMKDEVTTLSGRGVGLGAVRAELEKLGGSVEVKTFIGRGTEFRFKIPVETDRVWDLSIDEIIRPLIDTTNNFLTKQVGLEVESFEQLDFDSTLKLVLFKYTAFITIKGALEVLFVLSMEEPVLRKVLRNFLFEELTEEEEGEYMEDVLAECTNNILGNSLRLFDGLDELIIFDSPVFISSKDALVKYQESKILMCSIQTDEGKASISLVLPEKI